MNRGGGAMNGALSEGAGEGAGLAEPAGAHD